MMPHCAAFAYNLKRVFIHLFFPLTRSNIITLYSSGCRVKCTLRIGREMVENKRADAGQHLCLVLHQSQLEKTGPDFLIGVY